VAHDHFSGMHLALDRCAAAGRRRVGVALTVSANAMVRDRWLAAHAYHTGPGRELARLTPWVGGFAAKPFGAWLARTKPDVLVGTFEADLLAWLAGAGRSAAEDLALVSLSVPAGDARFAGIHQRSPVIGARAVDLLVGALNHNETGLLPMRQVLGIEGEWRDGASLPPAPRD
jgi:LacI family transcriptional regulator